MYKFRWGRLLCLSLVVAVAMFAFSAVVFAAPVKAAPPEQGTIFAQASVDALQHGDHHRHRCERVRHQCHQRCEGRHNSHHCFRHCMRQHDCD